MPTVQNIIKNAAGNAVGGGIVVNIDLVILDGSGNASLPQGFVDLGNVSTDYSINVGTTVTANSTTGVWTAVLVGNADVSQATSSLYRITENTSTPRTYYVNVPSSGGPYWVGSVLSSTPSLTGVVTPPVLTFRSLSANATLLASDSAIVATNAITLTLPAISGMTVGKIIYIKNANTTNLSLTIQTNGTDNGIFATSSGTTANQSITQGNARSYTTDGTKWYHLS